MYPGPTIQSRSAARRAAQDLVYVKCDVLKLANVGSILLKMEAALTNISNDWYV